jgi:hypothetical protein
MAQDQQWLGPLLFLGVGMSFFGSLFGGSNPTLNKDMAQYGQIGGFATGLGEQNLTQSSNFFSSLLSGDQSKQAQALAPQISSIQQRGQQEKQGLAQFGNRSGGTNAKTQMIGDQARGGINEMISSLLGSSASALGSQGSNLLSQGVGAYQAQQAASQQQMENWSNSILGKGITSGVAAGESFALGGDDAD